MSLLGQLVAPTMPTAVVKVPHRSRKPLLPRQAECTILPVADPVNTVVPHLVCLVALASSRNNKEAHHTARRGCKVDRGNTTSRITSSRDIISTSSSSSTSSTSSRDTVSNSITVVVLVVLADMGSVDTHHRRRNNKEDNTNNSHSRVRGRDKGSRQVRHKDRQPRAMRARLRQRSEEVMMAHAGVHGEGKKRGRYFAIVLPR